MLRLIDDVRKGKINSVIVKNLSRLGRDIYGVEVHIDCSLAHDVRFISLDDDIDTADGNLLYSVIHRAAMAVDANRRK